MATTNDAALVSTLQQAGFQGQNLRVAYAVAKAESGGNPRALNPNPPDLSYGLFQINMLGDLGPARRKQYGLPSNESLFDPLTNARVAFQLSGGGSNWRPWTTFTSGRYLAFIGGFPGAQGSAVKSEGGGVLDALWGATLANPLSPVGAAGYVGGLLPGLPGLPDIPNPLSWGQSIAKALTWPFANWDRMLEVVGGGIILLTGLYLTGRKLGAPPLRQIAPLLETPGRAFERGVGEGLDASGNPRPRSSTRARAQGRETGKQVARSRRLGTPVDRAPRRRVALEADQPPPRRPRSERAGPGSLPEGF